MAMHWVYLGVSIGAEVLGTAALKISSSFTRPLPSLVAVASYAVAFYLLSLALEKIPLGVAYAIWCGLGIILVALVGVIVFKDPVDAKAQIGILLIIAGIALVTLFSNPKLH